MQIKTTLRYHLTPIRLVNMAETENGKLELEKLWENWNTNALLAEL